MPWDLMNSASNLFWFMRIMGRKIKKHTNAAESEKSFMLICDTLFEAILWTSIVINQQTIVKCRFYCQSIHSYLTIL